MDKINLKEILNRVYDKEYRSSYKTEYSEQCILEAMKEACNQVLELAAENADYGVCQNDDGQEPWIHESNIFIDKQSILDTINQIE